MPGEGVHLLDDGPHRNVAPVNPQKLGAIDQGSPPGADRLKTGDEHGGARIGEAPGEMVKDPSAIHHAAGGDHDARAVILIDRLRFLSCFRHFYKW